MISILRFSSLMLAVLFLGTIGLNSSLKLKDAAPEADQDRTVLIAGFDDS